eukprot:5018287-Alexandrium_andersonii.AAC.1
MALGRPLPGGKCCAPPLWRASGSPAGRPALVASTTLSWTSGASCVETTVPSQGTARTWTWSGASWTR